MPYDNLTNRTFYEYVDRTKVNQLLTMLNNGTLQLDRYIAKHSNDKSVDEAYNDIRVMLTKYKNKIKQGIVKVEYTYAIPNFGRVTARCGNVSLGSLVREVRSTLAVDNYVDIDIVNCHPVLILQLCKRYHIMCKYLRTYVNQRDRCLQVVMDRYNVTRDAAKTLFLQIMYNGTFTSWCHHNNITNAKPIAFIEGFANEFTNISKCIIKRHPSATSILINSGKLDNTDNILGTTMSWIMQNYERSILNTMIGYLRDHGYDSTHTVLCYDGFMLPKDSYCDELLHELEQCVLDEHKFVIELKCKPMETIEIH